MLLNDTTLSYQLTANSTWRTAAIITIVKTTYIREKSSDFDEI